MTAGASATLLSDPEGVVDVDVDVEEALDLIGSPGCWFPGGLGWYQLRHFTLCGAFWCRPGGGRGENTTTARFGRTDTHAAGRRCVWTTLHYSSPGVRGRAHASDLSRLRPARFWQASVLISVFMNGAWCARAAHVTTAAAALLVAMPIAARYVLTADWCRLARAPVALCRCTSELEESSCLAAQDQGCSWDAAEDVCRVDTEGVGGGRPGDE